MLTSYKIVCDILSVYSSALQSRFCRSEICDVLSREILLPDKTSIYFFVCLLDSINFVKTKAQQNSQ